ncbi:MAG: hypothetical protein AAGB31_11800 [Bdellovibrio sp.]
MADSSTEKIVIAIEMEDGSVRQGFVNIEKQAKDTSDKINKTTSGSTKLIDFEEIARAANTFTPGIVSNFGRMGLAAGAVGLAVFGVKSAIDLALSGEEIIAIRREFELLAQGAGLMPETFRQKLEAAAAGMADMEDILRASSSAINSLGENASRLPELLDLSRKAATAMGLEINDVYSTMIKAIESGNSRALRQYSIYIDNAEATKQYARSLGLAASDLDLAQRQQAILNAAIEVGGKRFKDINTEITPVGNSIKVAREAIKDLVDSVAVSIAESGPMRKFAQVLKDMASFKSTNNAATEVADLIARKARAQYEIAELERNMTAFNARASQGIIADRKKEIEDLTKEIQKSGAIITQNSTASVAAAKAEASANDQSSSAIQGKLTAEQQFTVAYRNQLIERASLAQQLSLAKASEGEISQMLDIGQTRLATLASLDQQEYVIREQYQLENQMLENQYRAGAIQSQQEYNAQRIQLETNFQQQLATIRNQQILNQEDPMTLANETMTGYQSVMSGFQSTLTSASQASSNFAKTASKNFQTVGAQMFNSIGSGAANAFAAFGTAVVSGENALEAFTSSLLRSMGQMAIQLGTQFILQGAAYMWAGMPNGAALMAAGAALAAFGGVLSGIGGGNTASAASSTASSSGGGVSDSATSETVKIVSPEGLERKQETPSVNLTIEGDIFDSDETGLRIADILNSAFSKNGVKVLGVT